MIRYIIPLLLCFSCTQQSEVQTEDNSEPEWIKPDVQGDWELVSTVKIKETPFLNAFDDLHEPPGEDTPIEPPYTGPHLIFENDSVFEVLYPMSMEYRYQFSVEDGLLHIRSGRYHKRYPIESANDTLFIYRPHNGYDSTYIKEGYIQTTLNDSIVNILRTHEANYPEFAGKWHLVTESAGEYGEHYELKFPHELPDSIEISRDEFIAALDQNKRYLLSTDGEFREYFFHHFFGKLVFTPSDWYDGDDPWIHFEPRPTN